MASQLQDKTDDTLKRLRCVCVAICVAQQHESDFSRDNIANPVFYSESYPACTLF
jgi:hypothetical protein